MKKQSTKLKLLSSGKDVELIAFENLTLKNFKVSLTLPKNETSEYIKILVLVDKDLFVMTKTLSFNGDNILVKDLSHEIYISQENIIGYIIQEIIPEKKCIGCKKQSVKQFSPFCSKQCKVIDLGSWVSGDYKVSEEIDSDPSYNDLP